MPLYICNPPETPTPVNEQTTCRVTKIRQGAPWISLTVSVQHRDANGAFVAHERVEVFLGHLTEGGTRTERPLYADDTLLTDSNGMVNIGTDLVKTDTCYLRLTSAHGDLTVRCLLSDEVKRALDMIIAAPGGVNNFIEHPDTAVGPHPPPPFKQEDPTRAERIETFIKDMMRRALDEIKTHVNQMVAETREEIGNSEEEIRNRINRAVEDTLEQALATLKTAAQKTTAPVVPYTPRWWPVYVMVAVGVVAAIGFIKGLVNLFRS